MQLWEVISMLCQKVVEEQNVFLNISITNDGWNIQLMPFYYEEDDDECED